jgi:hypothetical protein
VTQQIAAGAIEAGRGARLVFNDRLDATVCAAFMLVTALVVVTAAWEWLQILRRRKPAELRETPFVETAYVG